MFAKGLSIVAFDRDHAEITATARELYGRGNGRGGRLNFGDLMVYAIAKSRAEPLLCTGRDFASTDREIHPASRLSP
jgi:ribonuclease VapC